MWILSLWNFSCVDKYLCFLYTVELFFSLNILNIVFLFCVENYTCSFYKWRN